MHRRFVEPRASVEGQSPAERAGVGVEGKDKWLSLLKAALTTKGGTPN